MASGFRPIEEVLGRSQGALAQWPRWSDLVAGSVPQQREVTTEILNRLISRRICVVMAPQAHRKTVTAKLLAFELAKLGWASWYADAEHLNVAEASAQVSALDQNRILFIVDDAHKAPDIVEYLLPTFSSLDRAACLILSRPARHVRSTSGQSWFGLSEDADIVVELTVTRALMELMVTAEWHARAGQGTGERYRPTEAEISRVMDISGNDLEIVNGLLTIWSPESSQPLASVLDTEHLYRFVVERRLSSRAARETLLPLSALYQYEIPAHVTFLPEADTFLQVGAIHIASASSPGSGVYVRLSHPSLASLYLRSAERHGFIGGSLSRYTTSQVAAYLKCKPTNFRDVLRGLDASSKRDIIRTVVADREVLNALVDAVALPATRFIDCAAVLNHCGPYLDDEAVSSLLTNFLLGHSPERLARELFEMNARQLSFVSHALRMVEPAVRRKSLATVTPTVMVGQLPATPTSGVFRVFEVASVIAAWTDQERREGVGSLTPGVLVTLLTGSPASRIYPLLATLPAWKAVEVCLIGLDRGVAEISACLPRMLRRCISDEDLESAKRLVEAAPLERLLDAQSLTHALDQLTAMGTIDSDATQRFVASSDVVQLINRPGAASAVAITRLLAMIEDAAMKRRLAHAISGETMSRIVKRGNRGGRVDRLSKELFEASIDAGIAFEKVRAGLALP